MSGEEILRVVVSSAASLIVAMLLLQLELGGRRRRQRREIREELDLIGQLSDRPEVAALLTRRVDLLLDRYAPKPRVVGSMPGRSARTVILSLVVGFSIFAGLYFASVLAPNADLWVSVLAGVGMGALGAGVVALDERRMEFDVDLVKLYEAAKVEPPESELPEA
jgi:MFS family permease